MQPYFDEAKAFAGKKIEQPAAFVFGNADGMIKMRALKREDLAPAVSNLTAFVELDGIGHWPQLEASDAINDELVKFIKSMK